MFSKIYSVINMTNYNTKISHVKENYIDTYSSISQLFLKKLILTRVFDS